MFFPLPLLYSLLPKFSSLLLSLFYNTILPSSSPFNSDLPIRQHSEPHLLRPRIEGRRKSEQGLAVGQQEEYSSDDDDGKEVEVFPTRFMAKKKVEIVCIVK
jgi:hypothetical protein